MTPTPSPWGAALDVGSGGYRQYGGGNLVAAGPMSALVVFHFRTNTSSHQRLLHIRDGSSNPKLVLETSSTGPIGDVESSGFSTLGTPDVLPLGAQVLGASITGVGAGATLSLFTTGRQPTPTTSTASTPTSLTVEIGRYDSANGQYALNPISAVYIWNRVLAPSEFQMLSIDPFCFLRM
jgi:hypothetical protein